MEEKRTNPPQEKQPRHEEGDPVSLQQDPAQFDPTGGAGLMNPANDRKRDLGGPIPPDSARPTK